MKTLLTIALFFVLFTLPAQSIRVTNNVSQAEIVVYITDNLSDADMIVYITQNLSESCFSKGMWYLSSTSKLNETVVYITHNRSMADIRIFLTNNKSQAKWLAQRP